MMLGLVCWLLTSFAPKNHNFDTKFRKFSTTKRIIQHQAQTPHFCNLNPTFAPHFDFRAPLFHFPAPCRAPPPPPAHVLSQLRAGQYIIYIYLSIVYIYMIYIYGISIYIQNYHVNNMCIYIYDTKAGSPRAFRSANSQFTFPFNK